MQQIPLLTPSMTALEQARTHLEQLERQVAEERRRRLENLHFEVGFATAGELVQALQALDAEPASRVRRKAASPTAAPASGGRPPILTVAKRAAIKADLDGGATVAEVMRTHGCAFATARAIRDGKAATAKGRRLTEKERAAMTADLKAGLSLSATAEKYQCSTPTVLNVKKAAGLVGKVGRKGKKK